MWVHMGTSEALSFSEAVSWVMKSASWKESPHPSHYPLHPRHWIGSSWYPEASSAQLFCPFPNLVAPGPSLPTLSRFPVVQLYWVSTNWCLKHCIYIICQSQEPGVKYSSHWVKIQGLADVGGGGPGKRTIYLTFSAKSYPYPLNFFICFGHIFCLWSSCWTWWGPSD